RSDAFVDWDTRLTVDRVAGLIGHVDGLMLCQRLVDVETGERTQAIGRNDFTPPSKWVADDLPEPFSFLRVPPEADHQAMIDFFDHPEQVAYIATRNGYGLICRAENVPVMQRANAQAVKLVESYRKRGEYLQDEPRLVQELEAFMRDLLGPR
ncbi:MAG TPA: hypothetical protein VJK50_04975, partial [Patescibacteria group bacterium]|nr:hypothetical protein [Patescibacteria group bacterium]